MEDDFSGTNSIFCMREIFTALIRHITLALLLATMLPMIDDNTLHAEKKKIILQHADTIEGGDEGGATYRSVLGNVVFHHDALTLRCDRATDYPQENKIVLQGHVFLSDSVVELYGDSGVYYPERQVGELRGNVKGRMVDNTLAGKAQRGTVNMQSNQITLYDDVLVWHGAKQISGDTILLLFQDAVGKNQRKKLKAIDVKGSAFLAARDSLSRSPVVYDQFSGKNMLIMLDELSKISGITLTTQAESLYHLYDEQRQPAGINYSSGDVIQMVFAAGKLSRIKVGGGVEGKQYPESFRGMKKINLPAFVWREKENPFGKLKNLP